MKKRSTQSKSGIALFMVISCVALLAVLLTEITYTSQMGSRLAYNSIDNLKAYYLAKSAYKLALVRLKAFMGAKKFLNNSSNKTIKEALGSGIATQIWSMPFIYPIPVMPNATVIETDAVNDFQKKSSLTGSFTLNITGESAKLNLNNLILATQTAPAPTPIASPSPGATPGPTPNPNQSNELDFKTVLEPAIQSELNRKKTADNEFADTYRNVTGKDIVDAISAYIGIEGSGTSNLPGFSQNVPKKAPFYSLTELHLIPGFDDRLYQLLSPLFTVYATPGINVNRISKESLMALIPELLEADAEDIITKRDDPELGKLWNDEKEFWTSITAAGSAARSIQAIQDRFKKGGIKILTDEESFKINILSNVGQASKKVEAYVILDKDTGNKPAATPLPGTTNNAANFTGQNNAGNQDVSSAKPTTGINLIYWKSI